MSVYGGVDSSKIELYSGKMVEKVNQLKKQVSGESSESVETSEEIGKEEINEQAISFPPVEKYEPPIEVDVKMSEKETGPIRISLLPTPRSIPAQNDQTRYIGFLPHSGVHNQRIALQNALLLGKLLGRTVLVPPIWIGWPISTLPYNELVSFVSPFPEVFSEMLMYLYLSRQKRGRTSCF
jgi:hypothetical protein